MSDEGLCFQYFPDLLLLCLTLQSSSNYRKGKSSIKIKKTKCMPTNMGKISGDKEIKGKWQQNRLHWG